MVSIVSYKTPTRPPKVRLLVQNINTKHIVYQCFFINFYNKKQEYNILVSWHLHNLQDFLSFPNLYLGLHEHWWVLPTTLQICEHLWFFLLHGLTGMEKHYYHVYIYAYREIIYGYSFGLWQILTYLGTVKVMNSRIIINQADVL